MVIKMINWTTEEYNQYLKNGKIPTTQRKLKLMEFRLQAKRRLITM